jgi:hypothetical protein
MLAITRRCVQCAVYESFTTLTTFLYSSRSTRSSRNIPRASPSSAMQAFITSVCCSMECGGRYVLSSLVCPSCADFSRQIRSFVSSTVFLFRLTYASFLSNRRQTSGLLKRCGDVRLDTGPFSALAVATREGCSSSSLPPLASRSLSTRTVLALDGRIQLCRIVRTLCSSTGSPETDEDFERAETLPTTYSPFCPFFHHLSFLRLCLQCTHGLATGEYRP